MERMEGSEAVSDSQQQFLQPISKFFPPNELLGKNYAPDEKPILKLMKLDKQQSSTNPQLKKRYKTTFQSQDTLGYQYSYALNNQIVYLKFNNQNYFKYKIKNRTYKYLAGMFLPLQKILTAEVKASKNIYKILPDIDYSQYKINIEDSFAKNSKFSNNKTLKFSSNYQSGNLFIAMKKKQNQYDLILQNDINSKGNTQWFNFAVQFHQQGTYRFNILNFTKSYSQYQDGMRVVCFSYKDQEMGLGGWIRSCNNIKYEQSSVHREEAEEKYYSCLKFDYVCSYSTDKVIFSYFYPYTSLDLERFLKKVLYRKINVHMKLQKTRICETLSGLPIYAITIQHKKNHVKQENNGMGTSSPNLKTSSLISPRLNKSVVIMARQHPGQTQGSFITQGIIDILMENGELDHMKRSVDFHIFPMINADGVLYGNYRTNLSGADLNRIWRNPKKQLQPQVYYIKKYLHTINKQSPISLIIDLHGHSKSLNSFFYGNPPKKDSMLNITQDSRLFPYVCSKKIKQISFNQSTFNITEDKKHSARVVLSEMFPKAHVYTLQNSFHGWRKDHNTIHEYTPDMLRKIGRELVVTFLEYDKLCEKNPQIKQKWTKQINQLKSKNDKQSDSEGGSDSEADFQLIQLDDPFEKMPCFDNESKSIFDSKNDLENLMKKQNKQNFISRNLLIKTQIYNRSYNRYNRKIISSQDSQSFTKAKRQSKQLKNNEISVPSQGFLSIVKIKTNNVNILQGGKIGNSQLECLEKYSDLESKATKQSIIDKLKRKKIRIQQAVHSSSGMKTFLRTMGIPLQKKLF